MSVKNQNIDTLVKMGERRLKKGQFEDALSIFDFALTFDGKNEKLLEYKSIALNELDRSDEAYQCIERIADINPEKRKWLDKALSIEPENPQGLYHMGVVYYEQGKFDEAIKMYEEAIKNFPKKNKHDIAEAYQNLGCSLWEARRREEALDSWKTCLKYNPSQRYAKKNLKDFTNAYGMGKSPVGMDDPWAFVDLKQQEYLTVKGRDSFDDTDDENAILKKIMDAWNKHIAEKHGKTLDGMKTKEKMELFNKIKVFS